MMKRRVLTTPEEIQILKELYDAGDTYAKMGQKLKVSPMVIIARLRENKLTYRKKHSGAKEKFTLSQQEHIYNEVAIKGKSVFELAGELDCDFKTIRRIVKKLGAADSLDNELKQIKKRLKALEDILIYHTVEGKE